MVQAPNSSSMPTQVADVEFDYVIVGAGTAGCLLANRLSANPQVRVLLLEAGGDDNYHWIHIPVGYLHCIGNPRTDWCLSTQPVPGLNGRALRYPRGKVLGGCSSINGMIYMRGQSRDYDHWADLTGDPRWGWDACLPAFLAHEDHWRDDPGNAWHRQGGEWRVERQRLRWDVLDAFAQAAQEAGLPASTDFNRGNNEGVGYFEVNQRRGVRWNAAKAFLKPARHRANLTVWTHAQAQNLALEVDPNGGLVARGVVVHRRAGERAFKNATERVMVRARREVILAAGAIASPLLLERSGVGAPAVLQRAGITPQLALPGVGENLQDHLQIRAVFGVQGVKTLNQLVHRWWGKAAIGLEYLVRQSGPMSMAPSQLGAFARATPELAWPNLQFHVQPLSLDAFGEPLHRHAAFTASVCNLNPTSRGSSHVASAEIDASPAIQPNYLATAEDRDTAAQSLRLTRRIAAQPALARYHPQELKPGVEHQSDQALARLAGDIGTTIFHPVGTCRMGRAGDDAAVVDSQLRVRGVRALRVADASVMPTITSGNTNAPTLMIAERAAALILAGG